MTESEIRERIEHFTRLPQRSKLRIFADTSEFMRIEAGDVIELESSYYLVRGEEVEGRFDLDGEPKYWVKRAISLTDGSSKIIKLVFRESFFIQLGEQEIMCFRSPQKEARILDKTRNDPLFMQGVNVRDSAGNLVRVVDKIQGVSLLDFIARMTVDHKTYYFQYLEDIIKKIIDCIEAIGRLHRMKEMHGDVRSDHILIDRYTGSYVWIDFDYAYEWSENPFGVDLFGLGFILLLTVGKGFHAGASLAGHGWRDSSALPKLTPADLSLFFQDRIVNLRRLFPYLSDSLNNVLLHFSRGSTVFYETAEELLEDLHECELY